MLVSVQNVSKGFLDKSVLRGVSLDIRPKERVGLLGVNAAGKTTLLNLLCGKLEPDEGSIVRAKHLEIGYLRQNEALSGERTLEEEARDAFFAVEELQKQLESCAASLAEAPHDEDLLWEYDLIHSQLEAQDAYQVDAKINRVLMGLGFGAFDRNTRVSTLSGGEKMRFGIAKMLLHSPGLLILDEPTNHLDFSMLTWLEAYLSSYPGAVLTVSHDRYFLDKVATSVCEIENGRLSHYTGSYSSFVVQKEERQRTALRAYEKQQEEIAAMEEYVRRNQARASTANMASSRVKALEKMERIEKPYEDKRHISLRFDFDLEPFSTVLTCENFAVSVGEGEQKRQLYKGLSLEIKRGEKVAVVGLNGVGKSTFLKAVQGLLPHEGLVRWGGNVRLGYFDQELAGLPMHKSVLDAVHSVYPAKTELEIRTALGRMLLSGEEVYKRVEELSGAGRAKVAFTILLMKRANVLLLDEPTNHLDYRAKEELEQALQRFPGTVLAISHDRYFLRRVPHCILELTPSGFLRYDGNYDEYLQKKEQEGKAGESTQQKREAPKKELSAKERRAQDAQRRNEVRALEAEMEELEAAIERAKAAMEAPENSSDYELLATLGTQLEADTARLDEVSEAWLLTQE